MDTLNHNQSSQPQSQPQIQINDVPVTNQNEALQMLVYFINLAQKRGTYSIDESAKIYECIKIFSGRILFWNSAYQVGSGFLVSHL